MARVRVYNTQTGQWGTVSEQFASNPKFSTSAPQAPAQQKGFLENLIGSLVAPGKRTIQRVVGAGQEIGLDRKGKLEEADRLMKEAQKRMMAGDMSDMVKQMLNQAEQLSKGAQQDTVASRNQEVLTDPLQIAKDSAAILSYGIPAKGALGMGRTGTGALTGATGGFGYSQKTDLEGILGDVVKGGVIGGVTGKVSDVLAKRKLGKLNKATEGADDITGGDIRRFNTSKKQYTGGLKTSDPNYLKKAIENQKNVQSLTKTGSDTLDQLASLTNQKSALDRTKSALLDTSTNTVSVDDLNTFIKSYVTEGVNPSLLDDALLQQQLDYIAKNSVNGQVSSKILDDVRLSLGDVSQAYGKAAAGASQNVPSQATSVKIERALKTAIDQLDPQVGKTISDMAPIIKGIKALNPSVTSSVRAPIFGDVTMIKRTLERIGDVSTRADAALFGGASTASKAAPGAVSSIAPNFLQQLSKQTSATPAIVGSLLGREQQEKPATQPTSGMQQPTAGIGQGQATDILSMLGLDMQSLMLISALPVKEQNAVLTELIGKKVTEGTGKVGSTQLISDAATQAYQALSGGDIKTGMLGGRAEKIKSQLGIGGDQATLDFNIAVQNIFSAIAKARGGTALTDSEKELLKEYLPVTGDSKQTLETKLRYIIQNPEVVVLGK